MLLIIYTTSWFSLCINKLKTRNCYMQDSKYQINIVLVSGKFSYSGFLGAVLWFSKTLRHRLTMRSSYRFYSRFPYVQHSFLLHPSSDPRSPVAYFSPPPYLGSSRTSVLVDTGYKRARALPFDIVAFYSRRLGLWCIPRIFFGAPRSSSPPYLKEIICSWIISGKSPTKKTKTTQNFLIRAIYGSLQLFCAIIITFFANIWTYFRSNKSHAHL